MIDYCNEIGKDGWSAVWATLILADKVGNIGFITLSTLPIRKDETPYIGTRVLDGRTSEHDWVPNKVVPMGDLP